MPTQEKVRGAVNEVEADEMLREAATQFQQSPLPFRLIAMLTRAIQRSSTGLYGRYRSAQFLVR
jgi:hypothetical protein